MVTPDIETSTREERLEFIREEFRCLGNGPICGKCNFLRGTRGGVRSDLLKIEEEAVVVSSSVIIILDELLVKWEL